MTEHHTLICFDFGTKSIGIAIGQEPVNTTNELPPIPAKEGIPNWDDITGLIEEWKPTLVLVGLPLNMDGSEQELTRRARKFGNRLHGRFGLRLEFVDERLRTRAAQSVAHERGHKGNYNKAPVDSIAARLILESWYSARSNNKE